MAITRADAEHDAMLLSALPAGYHELPDRGDRQRLDEGLDRLLRAGYITFRFEGRVIDTTAAGIQARLRATARGWMHGRMIDAGLLYKERPPG